VSRRSSLVVLAVIAIAAGSSLGIWATLQLRKESVVLRSRSAAFEALVAAANGRNDDAVIQYAKAYFGKVPRHPSHETEERVLSLYETALLRWVRFSPLATAERSKQEVEHFSEVVAQMKREAQK
jgi:hypothetical protein